MKKIILTNILILVVFFCFPKEKKYINKTYGFSVEIPDKIEIINELKNFKSLEELIKNSASKYYIKFRFFDINKFGLKLNKNEIISMLNKHNSVLVKYSYDSYENGSNGFFKINDKIIGEYIFDIGSPMIGWEYHKFMNFVNGNYIINLVVMYCDPKDKIAKKYPDYFEYAEGEGYYWRDPVPENCKKFYNLIKTKSPKAPKELIKLEEYFDEIINSLELFDSESSYYTPTVSNLRFRETPDLNGKYIRSLKQGEKLELIEKGKEETINGTKGTWVKVKTEKGEIGWCFDAFLEPYVLYKKSN